MEAANERLGLVVGQCRRACHVTTAVWRLLELPIPVSPYSCLSACSSIPVAFTVKDLLAPACTRQAHLNQTLLPPIRTRRRDTL